MTTSAFFVEPAQFASEQMEARHFAPGEIAGAVIPYGTVIIKYRSGDLDRFPGVPAAAAREMAEKVHDSRAFSGTLMIECAGCIGIINMAEVESITFLQGQNEAQP
ncbi:hypothetical protein [Paracoccus saliphilus]|uniref:Uncharacterized protein n=1 Tax=Paracoccus saliphilus TaxID=405559 RepID=A0AA46A6G6_9RHOB|nr:hypothetical protein [Paracoccus saliphilus]WCR01657.1 hypothetical protein JHX88_12015 [Paracoccus saliphilus]SIS98229.1 hypothetical protein SAMN05421772_11112 [Paracoccus saliphilus]